MIRLSRGWRFWTLVLPVIVTILVAAPAAAQGRLQGVILDAQGEPVEGATVTISQDTTSRQWRTKTDRRGEFMQIGLPSGTYNVKAEKDGLASVIAPASVNQSRSNEPFRLQLLPPGVDPALAADPEALAKGAAMQAAFDAGVAANAAGDDEEAIARFNEAIGISEVCADCYYNVGVIYARQKKYAEAEMSYKKAIEHKADYADAYNGLANVYNAQRKFDEAGEASAKAAELSGAGLLGGGGDADTLARQAMILFNGGKQAEAKPIAEQALALDATNADAHFIMGMILLTTDPAQAKSELESYLTLATDLSGQNAATAKALIPELEKMIPK